MKILVPMKITLNSDIKVTKDDLKKEDLSYMSLNPYDERALELALSFKDLFDDVEILVISFDIKSKKEIIRKALSVGADRAFFININESTSSRFIVSGLESFVKKEKVDIVIMGQKNIEYSGMQVPAMLAESLSYVLIDNITSSFKDGSNIHLSFEERNKTYSTKLLYPAIITTGISLNELRMPNIMNILSAKKKKIEEVSFDYELPSSNLIELGNYDNSNERDTKIYREKTELIERLKSLL